MLGNEYNENKKLKKQKQELIEVYQKLRKRNSKLRQKTNPKPKQTKRKNILKHLMSIFRSVFETKQYSFISQKGSQTSSERVSTRYIERKISS